MKVEKWAREWEEYQGGPNEATSERFHVTLNVRCILLLNRRVFDELGTPGEVMLMFDKRNMTIGVRPARDGDVKPFPVKKHPKGSHHAVYAKPFCRHYKVIPTRHVKFSEPYFDSRGVLVLSLQRTEPVVPKRAVGNFV